MLKESMARGQTPSLTLTSSSMRPLLHAGDQVQIEAAKLDALHVGDIVTLVDADNATQLLTHRFWGARSQSGEAKLVTRGDRPLLFDPPLPAHRLVGRVIARQRGDSRLPLNDGIGRRLNCILARIADAELRWLTGLEQADWVQNTAAANARAARQQSRRHVRLLRKVLLSGTSLLVTLTGKLASLQTHKSK